MKCPKCGFNNHRPGTRCVRCGNPFPELQQQLSIEPELVQQTKPSVPDWRKEVTRKAREYGERKKILTTPPRPLKENANDPEHSIRHKSIVPAVEASTATIESEPIRITPEVFPPALKSSPQPLLRDPQPRRRLELDLEPILPPGIELESDTNGEHPLNIGRRFAALLVDHAILIGLTFAVTFFFREVLSYDLRTKFESWFPIVAAMLLFHFLYYFYFHTTSRQTPGQVFLSLEVRNPSGGSISAGKVFGRWAALVFLNVFNLVPLFLGKNFLLLDLLSGTEVRSFKEKNL
jgi:uncharacterized RDD family membrane protein YckC